MILFKVILIIIAIENGIDAVAENNSLHHNTCGILVHSTEPPKEDAKARLVNNRIWGNNMANFGQASGLAGTLAPGVGILIAGANNTEAGRNIIQDNGVYGIATVSLGWTKFGRDAEPGKVAELVTNDSYLHHNKYVNNGTALSDRFKSDYPELTGADLYWDGTGERNQWQELRTTKSLPADLLMRYGGIHTDVIEFQ